jgi:hypothetical protein
MPKMVITHGVADVETWLTFKAERAGHIASMGGLHAVDLVAEDGSNAVAIIADVDDPAAVLATLAAPPAELGEAMGRHGVVPPLTAYIEK